jgi:hypothetical protein
VGKAQRKQQESYMNDKEEHARHFYKVQKKEQNRKLTRDLDKALRNKDYAKLTQMDEY